MIMSILAGGVQLTAPSTQWWINANEKMAWTKKKFTQTERNQWQ